MKQKNILRAAEAIYTRALSFKTIQTVGELDSNAQKIVNYTKFLKTNQRQHTVESCVDYLTRKRPHSRVSSAHTPSPVKRQRTAVPGAPTKKTGVLDKGKADLFDLILLE